MCKTVLTGPPEISYEDCEESLFDTSIKLNKKRVYAKLRSSKWKKPWKLRAVVKEPLTQELLASSKHVLKGSTALKNKNKLQEIAGKVKTLHKLYLEMEKATTDKDTHLMKQIVRQASWLSAPEPSLEASLIASGVSHHVARSSLIRRVDKLGRYWAACATMAKLASNAKYRTLFMSMKLEAVPSYRTYVWPPNSKEKRLVHAEVQLVTHHRLHPSELPPRVIGISKAACYLCDLYLSKHKQFYYSGTHGTIFDSWIVPDLVEYSVSDVTELRQIIVSMNQKLLETKRQMKKPRAKGQSAYQSFIWSTPYQASTPPLSIREDHSVVAIPKIITPRPAGSIARTPPSLPQIRHDEGDAAENMIIPTAQSPNQARSAHSSRGNITSTSYVYTKIHGDLDGQNTVARNNLAISSPLPEGELDTAAAAQLDGELTTPTPSSTGAKTLTRTNHIEGPEPPASHVQLPYAHTYTAPPSNDPHAPTPNASAIHSLSSKSISSSSEIIISRTPKPLTPRRPLFASLPGIDLYFSLEGSPSLDGPTELISRATVALTELPSSAFLSLDGNLTCVNVAAMAPGEELLLESSPKATGGGLVELVLRNSEAGGDGVRVVCDWSG